MSRPLTYDHLVGRKKPLTRSIPVVLDPGLAEEYNEIRSAAEVAAIRAQNRPDDTDAQFAHLEAEQALTAARARLDEAEAVVWFKFRGIGRHRYEALAEAHPPTELQRIKARAGGMREDLPWNPETMPPALIAACLVEPQLTEEQAAALWNDPDWNQAELGHLFAAAIEVNGQRRTVELGKGSERTRSSGPKSPTA